MEPRTREERLILLCLLLGSIRCVNRLTARITEIPHQQPSFNRMLYSDRKDITYGTNILTEASTMTGSHRAELIQWIHTSHYQQPISIAITPCLGI